MILVTFPICILVVLAIKLDSPGPVFFVQRRCGLRGRLFPFIKFRTMYRNAEAQLEELRVFNEASEVGPRPPIPGEVGHYDLADRRRLSVRPGLTCLWQICGRNLLPFER